MTDGSQRGHVNGLRDVKTSVNEELPEAVWIPRTWSHRDSASGTARMRPPDRALRSAAHRRKWNGSPAKNNLRL